MSAAEKKVPGTAVATLEPPTDKEIESIRKRGAAAVAHRQEIAKIEKQLAGLTWGSGSMAVRGESFSPMTRAVLAEFCVIVRANPLYHVDVLGDKFYLNAVYWSDLINSRPDFHHYEQRDLSPSVEKALRERAARHREAAKLLIDEARDAGIATRDEAARHLVKALDMSEEADDLALARAQWSAPEWATVVIQTTIVKFIDASPLEAIRAGQITDIDRYLVQVHECNWAGNRPMAKKRDGGEYNADPIGNSEPAKTARTRSLRRAAVKSFSAWMQAYDRQIEKAEEALEAEFEVMRSERREARASLPSGNEPQAVRTGNGEPSAANANGAKDLPVEPQRQPAGVPGVVVPYREEEFTAPPPFDPADARKALFATWRDAGIADDQRKPWCKENGLPESTTEWTQEHHAKARDILLTPQRKKLAEGASIAGVDAEQLAQQTWGKPVARCTWKELAELNQDVAGLVDQDGGEPQARML